MAETCITIRGILSVINFRKEETTYDDLNKLWIYYSCVRTYLMPLHWYSLHYLHWCSLHFCNCWIWWRF